MRFWLAVCIAVACGLTSTSAQADCKESELDARGDCPKTTRPPPPPDTKKRAEALYAAAREQYERTNYDKTIELLTQARKLSAMPKQLLLLGHAYLKKGDDVRATASYEQYLAGPQTADGTKEARASLEAIAKRRPKGSLTLGAKPPCEIYIDGLSTGLKTPQRDMQLSSGKHRVTLINNEFGIKESFNVEIKPSETSKMIKDYSDQIRDPATNVPQNPDSRPTGASKSVKEIDAKLRAAYDSFDSLDLEEARKSLNQALLIVKKTRLETHPITARVYLALGLIYLGSGDTDNAKLSFVKAVEIDREIKIDAAYTTAAASKLLAEAKAETAQKPDAENPLDVCKDVRGLEHAIVDTAKTGKPLDITVKVGADVKFTTVVVNYRSYGKTDFVTVTLTRTEGCTFRGSIPASALVGDLLHYYVAARDANSRYLAGKGSAGSPNIVELSR